MSRNFGLDIIRSLAIIMVLISHSKIFIAPYFEDKFWIKGLGIFGVYGVELFFVLSGFLIGQILLRDVIPASSFASIFSFYIRRWFRTLPAYYLVLIILVLISNASTNLHNLHPLHFIFLQNFNPQEINFFGVSWSLSVEEWFYLLSPILFYFCLPQKPTANQISKLLLLSIIAIGLIRTAYVYYVDPTWDAGVRKLVPIRFDSLLFGILLANLKVAKPQKYSLLNNKYVLGFSCIGLIVITAFFIPKFPTPIILDQSLFARIISFPLISFFMALSLPFFEQNNYINHILIKNDFILSIFTKISLYSYMIYLIHLDIFMYFYKIPTSLSLSVSFLMCSLLLTFGISAITYKYYEKPLMDLRDKAQTVIFTKV